MAIDINKFREMLTDRIAELEKMEASGEDERAIVVLDQQAVGRLARMDLLQRQQMAKETHRRRALERSKILSALQRMDEDEFGWCVECGGEIASGRLEIDATVVHCIECAK